MDMAKITISTIYFLKSIYFNIFKLVLFKTVNETISLLLLTLQPPFAYALPIILLFIFIYIYKINR